MNKQPFYRNKVVLFLGAIFMIDSLLVTSLVARSIYLTAMNGTAITFTETMYVLVGLVVLMILSELIELSLLHDWIILHAKDRQFRLYGAYLQGESHLLFELDLMKPKEKKARLLPKKIN